VRHPAGPDDAGHGRLAVSAASRSWTRTSRASRWSVITATGKRPVLIDAAELVMKPLDLTQLFAAIERYCH
jgi:hypothetical protein